MSNGYRKRQERDDKRRKPGSQKDWLLKDMPDFGTGAITQPGSTLTFNDIREAVEKLKQSDPYGQSQAAWQQNYANQMAQAQQNNLANLLMKQGAGMATNSPLQWGINPAEMASPRRPTQTPMNPPKYLEGYRVTVRSGATVWTVHHFEERQDPYQGNVRYYYLENDKGQQSREIEGDLKIHEAGVNKKTHVDFDTVVISEEKRDQILEALEQVNQSDLIFETWGFGETIEKGKGVSMLFYGPPGTGKTLMAQAIANKLGKVLKVISTADIESSAPGEAERNIRKHFKESADGKSILLFDECDSLIYTRQNVGPILSAQINELLSQIERFNGITLFTTNRLGTLDEAVNRRLALKLEFEMPSAEERVLIWQRMFPKQAPLDAKIDWNRLAILEITGGYIKNSVLRAARMAAIEKIPDADKKITMKHLVKAVRLETESMIEFENARAEQEGKIGRVITPVSNTGRGRTIEKTQKVVEAEGVGNG